MLIQNSNLVSVPSGERFLSDVIASSPILFDGENPMAAAGGFEGDIDPNMDPELAMVCGSCSFPTMSLTLPRPSACLYKRPRRNNPSPLMPALHLAQVSPYRTPLPNRSPLPTPHPPLAMSLWLPATKVTFPVHPAPKHMQKLPTRLVRLPSRGREAPSHQAIL